MRRRLIASVLGSLVFMSVVAPATAQSWPDQQRWEAAQARWRNAQARYQDERARYEAERQRWIEIRGEGGYPPPPPPPYGEPGYPPPPPPGVYPPPPPPDDRYEQGYDPARYYRDAPTYHERVLAPSDRVYRGSDGRYYCRRSDGTTGLIIGAAGGGILGNVIDGGHSRAAGTLIGAAIGALAGRAIDQGNSQVRCR